MDVSPDTNESRARRDFVPEGVSYLSGSEGQFSLVELQQTLEVEEDSLSCFRPQIAANSDQMKSLNNDTNALTSRFNYSPYCASAYPGIFPPGPMDVWNIRLKEIGGERSFPVVGDLTLYFTKRSVSSCWV